MYHKKYLHIGVKRKVIYLKNESTVITKDKQCKSIIILKGTVGTVINIYYAPFDCCPYYIIELEDGWTDIICSAHNIVEETYTIKLTNIPNVMEIINHPLVGGETKITGQK